MYSIIWALKQSIRSAQKVGFGIRYPLYVFKAFHNDILLHWVSVLGKNQFTVMYFAKGEVTHHNPKCNQCICPRYSVLLPFLDPFSIFFPLSSHVPKPSPSLCFPSDTTIQAQERERITLTQHLLAFSGPPAFAMLTLTRNLASPLGPLYRFQLRRRGDYASREHQDGNEELDGDVEGKRRVREGCRMFVG